MKKFKVVALGFAMVAAMSLVGCSKKQAASASAAQTNQLSLTGILTSAGLLVTGVTQRFLSILLRKLV